MVRTSIVTCSVTERGAALARRLPYEHHHRDLVETVRRLWPGADGLILVCATGIAVRAIAPLLSSKASDPAVVCVDDTGRWAITLVGGHARQGNDLAREVAALTGGQPVVTTATDGAGLPALDELPGWRAEGDLAGMTRRWLDGHPPALLVDPSLRDWPLPPQLDELVGPGGAGAVGQLRLTDMVGGTAPGQVLLRPLSLTVGVGASSGADPERLRQLVRDALDDNGLHPDAVLTIATIDKKAAEPAITGLADSLGVTLRSFSARDLETVTTPNPSSVVRDAVGTPSVAEAAALLAGGPGAELVVPKQKAPDATVAVARRARPQGHLSVIGVGPGDPRLRTPAASAAVRSAQVVIGYGPYVDLVSDLLHPRQHIVRYAIGEETRRCVDALERAAGGQAVGLVCSGDPGVYAMAGLVLELAPDHGRPPVEVIPGVTAALTAAALLGAPLGHDHAAISLSDLLTPWAVIERRLEAVAEADLVVSLYNPRSRRRLAQFTMAMDILRKHRRPDTPVAIVTDAGRPGQEILSTTLGTVDPETVGMVSIVLVGSSTTRWIDRRMVTPRGYGA